MRIGRTNRGLAQETPNSADFCAGSLTHLGRYGPCIVRLLKDIELGCHLQFALLSRAHPLILTV